MSGQCATCYSSSTLPEMEHLGGKRLPSSLKLGRKEARGTVKIRSFLRHTAKTVHADGLLPTRPATLSPTSPDLKHHLPDARLQLRCWCWRCTEKLRDTLECNALKGALQILFLYEIKHIYKDRERTCSPFLFSPLKELRVSKFKFTQCQRQKHRSP